MFPNLRRSVLKLQIIHKYCENNNKIQIIRAERKPVMTQIVTKAPVPATFH